MLKLKLQQAVREQNGIYTIYIQVVEETTGQILNKKCVQGKNKEDIKNAFRSVWQEIKQNYKDHQAVLLIAEQALVELEAE